MYLKRGSYTHELNDAFVRRRKEPVYADNRVLIGSREIWNIRGRLTGTDASDLSTKMVALEAAYAATSGNIVLLQNDGVTETCFKITGSQTVGGIRCTRLDNPMNDPGEFATYLDYELDVEGEFGSAGGFGGSGNTGNPIVSWSEMLDFKGNCGPQYVYRILRNGSPQRQVVSEATTMVVTQIGEAVGLYGYPSPPGPIWPGFEHQPERRIAPSSASSTGGQGNQQKQREFRIAWSYRFESSQPLSGRPSSGF